MAISLASISRSARMKAPKVVIYGVPGIGKTTFAAGAPSPIFIQAEEGLGLIDVPHFPLAQTYQDVIDAMTALLTEDHQYQTVVIDSLDRMEPMLWKHIAERDNKGDIDGYGYGKGLSQYAPDEWRVFTAGLDALREKGMSIVAIAHSDIVRFASPEHEPYDRYQMRLNKYANDIICDWSDALLFANYKVHVVKDKGKFNSERARAAGRGERSLYTQERPAFIAKNRYHLPPELPLEWAAFADAIGSSADTSTSPSTETNEPANIAS